MPYSIGKNEYLNSKLSKLAFFLTEIALVTKVTIG